MRSFTAVVAAATILASGIMAASADTVSPLPAGKPAGVEKAQLAGNGLLLILGLGIVAGGIVLVTTQGNSGNTITTTTTGTAPTGTTP
jgi:hypothetical protein